MATTIYSWLPVLLGFLLAACSIPTSTGILCGRNELECADESRCVRLQYVCDNVTDCMDSSDENPTLCAKWPRLDCEQLKMRCSYPPECVHIKEFCSGEYETRIQYRYANDIQCPISMDSFPCEVVNSGQLSTKGLPLALGKKEFVSSLMTVLNDSTSYLLISSRRCPMFYVNLNDNCYSFFTPAKLSWNESRLFCQSIAGELVSIGESEKFNTLWWYLRKNGATSDFWTGGHVHAEGRNKWLWVDGSPVSSAFPMWGLTNAGGRYELMPRISLPGQCASMSTGFVYFLTESSCLENKSPLCEVVPSMGSEVKQNETQI